MNSRTILSASLFLALAACGGAEQSAGEAPKDEAAAAPAAEASAAAAPAAAAAAPKAGEAPSREFVVGKWGTDGDCALAVELRADGTSDGPFGNWTYADGVIGFVDAAEAKITVSFVDDNTMDSTNAQGGKHKMTRCP